MTPPLDKLTNVARDLARSGGEFDLFGVFLHEGAGVEKWDLVVSAPWLDSGKQQSFDRVADALRKHLTTAEMLTLSRIVVLDADTPFVKDVLAKRGDDVIINGWNIPFEAGGVPIQRAFLITSKPQVVETGAGQPKR